MGVLLAPELRRILYELNRVSGAIQKAKKGLAVLRSFVGSLKIKVDDVTFGLDIEPEKGSADSGDLEIDLPALLVVIGEEAAERKSAIAMFIDEVQYFKSKELSALIMAMHKIQQKQLPIVLVGAGLPILLALTGDSKSYAERLFNFPDIGALSSEDVAKALQDPARASGVSFTEQALQDVYCQTQGYPYFVQEWGYQAWNMAKVSPIEPSVIADATETARHRLDANFYRVRYDRLTPSEKTFLRAMAQLGSEPQRIADIAAGMSRSDKKVAVKSLSPVRSNLIKKGMIYSPVHGELAFTVPLFNEFMLRAIPETTE